MTTKIEAFDALVRDLRERCPWDKAQTAKTIIPHTIEEVYELADAIERGDDNATIDELGDVTFQVFFLALLLEERGVGNLETVLEEVHNKLIRRHPHVFGNEKAQDADEALAVWQHVKKDVEERQQTVFADIPANLPTLLYARKLQRRAKTAALTDSSHEPQELSKLLDAFSKAITDEERSQNLGDLLFCVVDIARQQKIDPELALRAACERFRVQIEKKSIADR